MGTFTYADNQGAKRYSEVSSSEPAARAMVFTYSNNVFSVLA